FSLNYDNFKAQVKLVEEKSKKFKDISEYETGLLFESLPYEQQLISKDSSLAEKRKRWHETLAKDVYVQEALNVLDDLKANSKNSDLAARKE
ncbi:MAG: carboxy terminal-processing peptidase, partial [Psychroflexus sp.]